MKKVLQKGLVTNVRLIEEVLTDGSKVYNVEIGDRAEGAIIEIMPVDENQAQKIFNLIEESGGVTVHSFASDFNIKN